MIHVHQNFVPSLTPQFLVFSCQLPNLEEAMGQAGRMTYAQGSFGHNHARLGGVSAGYPESR